jgi:pentatricopeptide repeat protein
MKSGNGSHLIVQNALVTMYSKSGLVEDGFSLFRRIREKDLISWGSIIAGFAQQGYETEALQMFREMIAEGMHHPSEFHFGSVFSACSVLGSLEYGEQIHSLSVKYRLDRNSYAGCSLSDMYARCKKLESARRVFYGIDAPDFVCWNSIINACSVQGLLNDAMVLFSEMRDSGLRPDGITVRGLLCACVGCDALNHGRLIHSYLVKFGWMDKYQYAIPYSACMHAVWISPPLWMFLMRQGNLMLSPGTAFLLHVYSTSIWK